MGSNSSIRLVLARIIGRRSQEQMMMLNLEERKRLNKSWKRAKENTENKIGRFLLAAFIGRKPELSVFYKVDSKLSAEEMIELPQIAEVGDKFNIFMDNLIQAINTPQMENLSYEFGSKHYQKRVCFSAENWLHIKNVTIEVVMSHGHSRSVKKIKIEERAWTKFMTKVVREMKRGFIETALKQPKYDDDEVSNLHQPLANTNSCCLALNTV